jgi:hypothetical protein
MLVIDSRSREEYMLSDSLTGRASVIRCLSSAFVQQASCRFRSWAREGVKPDDSYRGEDCYELDADEYGSHYL